ncbi:MAG TPA: hypothetical protein VM145_04310 [Sphingomicrobium sp.]|nr:hypothetical protein [Sphingomicrobium sp.]
MNRCFAMMCALLFAFVSVSSACMAAPSDWVTFDLKSQGDRREIHATFSDERRGRDENHWSNGFKPSELIGLDVAGFYSAGSRPLRFAVVREAGRLDCAGNGGSARMSGNCSFTSDAGFMQLLASRGIGHPNRQQAFGLVALDVRRSLIDAVAAARYPTPSIDDLMSMTAIGVSPSYISQLASAGYRPKSLHTLVQFKALDITPQWIGGLARIGYANIPSDELVQLKALGIGADFIAGFNAIGYGRLPVDELVQLKALNVTPDFARAAIGSRRPLPTVDQLVQMKMFGRAR